MKKFFQQAGVNTTWAKDNNRLSKESRAVSNKAASSIEDGTKRDRPRPFRREAGKNKDVIIRRGEKRGRPAELTQLCLFCGEDRYTSGAFVQHFDRTHASESAFSLLPKGVDGNYKCPVAECTFDPRGQKERMRNHLKDTRAHSARDLLDNRIHAWHYRRADDDDQVRQIKEWLIERDLIDIDPTPEQVRHV